jgi:lipoprotein-anchoring transpeptidase ErfK/SrfK
MIVISIAQQRLHHRCRSGVWHAYVISTARLGVGNQCGSWQTPLGRHRVAALIGADYAIYTAFVARKAVGIYEPQHGVLSPRAMKSRRAARQNTMPMSDVKKDWILTRIIRLKGDQTGINRRGACDTFKRYIYIHGTHDEAALGTPVSHGCIRMANTDIIALFQRVRANELVCIRP